MAGYSYLIQEGDTLSGIAQAACGDASLYFALAALNNIPDPNVIYAGDALIIDCEAMQAWASNAGANVPPPPTIVDPLNPTPPPDASSIPPSIPPLSSITGGGAPTTD